MSDKALLNHMLDQAIERGERIFLVQNRPLDAALQAEGKPGSDERLEQLEMIVEPVRTPLVRSSLTRGSSSTTASPPRPRGMLVGDET